MLDSATRVFIDGGSVGAGLYKQKSNEANVNIIRDDVAAFVIDGADSETAAELQTTQRHQALAARAHNEQWRGKG
jgi:hypothetical protein